MRTFSHSGRFSIVSTIHLWYRVRPQVEGGSKDMKRFSGNRGGILKVLLIIFGVLFLCVVLGAVYVAMHWKQWTADFANVAAQELIRDSGLPDDQREKILADIRQLGDDFKTGKISTEELSRVVKTVSESPLVPLAGVQVARHQYIEPSDM